MWRLLCLALPGLLLTACDRLPAADTARQVAPFSESGELVVLIRNGATSFHVDAEGKYAGLEYDLVTRFSQQLGVKVRFVVVPRVSEMPDRLARGEAHLAVGISAPPASLKQGPRYLDLQATLVCRSKDRQPRKLDELGGGILMVASAFTHHLAATLKQHPELSWHEAQYQDTEELIDKVESGLIDYALVDARDADVARNIHPGVTPAFAVGPPLPVTWAWSEEQDEALGAPVKAFFDQIRKDGALARLTDRYFGHANRLQPIDATTFLSRRISILPKYRRLFIQAEASYGIDWRLLAALSYQESHWDAFATSAYGVRGMMMLTNDTADRLGVTNRLDPEQSIMGGAKYVGMLRDMLPSRIPEPDRTWLALASYNIGTAHLEDARILAQRLGKSPDAWSDMKTVIPLLRNYEYFSTLKYGYARGGETVVFVENVRSYYNILVRFEQPSRPMFPPFDEQVSVENPEGVRLRIDAEEKQGS
ncbi:membrane-bound lytic murein transglycosylase MltF [Chitinimonas sp. BJYL2]|uniref:membrane-bound lytic murein transglycosylase MltF n=1 Tax=Chitinimonas sp. BJYL2 TaxID=2976696 RepID=UPI0022B46DF8|nr:membrane-bound lytic murein transglycosylase MltF [Chitinimonas sp. BJYL2]